MAALLRNRTTPLSLFTDWNHNHLPHRLEVGRVLYFTVLACNSMKLFEHALVLRLRVTWHLCSADVPVVPLYHLGSETFMQDWRPLHSYSIAYDVVSIHRQIQLRALHLIACDHLLCAAGMPSRAWWWIISPRRVFVCMYIHTHTHINILLYI